MEGIFDAVKWTALVHKSGGGTGFNFSKLRPRGAKVGGGGFASGPVNFMRAFDAATDVVMRGGWHQGANMGVLNADHPDIYEFITAKEGGDLQNFNLSVGASDEFMKMVEKDKAWELINPHDGEVIQKVSAKSLFNQITNLAWRTGDPGMIFRNRINQDNPLPSLGPIEAVNVCGEQPLHSFDVCNLGSVDLAKFVRPGATDFKKLEPGDPARALNWNRLEEVVRLAVRFLDNGVNIGRYPLRQITKMARANRRVGLGVMGFADLLYQLMVPYDSELGLKAAEKIMSFINEVAIDESGKLAEEKGVFPNWEVSIFKDSGIERRNCTVTTIAPTGVISMVADTSSGIEPVFALAYVKDVVEESGLFYVNKYFQKMLEELNLFSFELIREVSRTGSLKSDKTLPEFIRQVFITAHEVPWQWHVKMQAAFQRFTENGVSKTINLPHTATVDEVSQAYLLAWKLGCKGITVYRDRSKTEQILKAGSGESSEDKRERIQTKLTITPLKKIKRHLTGLKCPECNSS
jgi:ribonucleoside-diphosphate reductase alpha chain